LLRDIAIGTPAPVMAARFHTGLAQGLIGMVEALRVKAPVALSGGVFQNRLLLEQVMELLEGQGYKVLTHRTVPANDGGLALGQAIIAAAQMLRS
jgi:hydrogenase maturation protein HypF